MPADLLTLLRLIGDKGLQPQGGSMAGYFIQPDFLTLVHSRVGTDGIIHDGLLTIGNHDGRSRSLRGRVWRVDDQVRVLAEFDINDLERMQDALLELNRDYSATQLKLAQTIFRLKEREAQIRESSLTDPLTGVGNRRRLDQALVIEVERNVRTGESICAIMADLDHFKSVNDIYGHQAGDAVLAAFGALLRQHTRAIDIVTRFGGEEFVILMPHIDLEQAVTASERLRKALAAYHIEPLRGSVTASFGVAELSVGEEGTALLHRIDCALYEAKWLGRNCVVANHDMLDLGSPRHPGIALTP